MNVNASVLQFFRFTYNQVYKNVKKTNELFGGLNPEVTNVYSSHGQVISLNYSKEFKKINILRFKLDPWRAVGLQEDLNEFSPTVIIDSYSHVPDLLSIASLDSPQMKASKLRVQELVKQWLNLKQHF